MADKVMPLERAKEAVVDGVERAREAVVDQLDTAREVVGDAAKKASREVRREAERATKSVREGYDTALDGLRTGYDKVRKDMSELSDDVAEYVRDNPGKSILIAAGVGFLLGVAFRPREDD
jgi:ElaB/YqjD/DUF883 family membrane-anchored ribosome-binding protein